MVGHVFCTYVGMTSNLQWSQLPSVEFIMVFLVFSGIFCNHTFKRSMIPSLFLSQSMSKWLFQHVICMCGRCTVWVLAETFHAFPWFLQTNTVIGTWNRIFLFLCHPFQYIDHNDPLISFNVKIPSAAYTVSSLSNQTVNHPFPLKHCCVIAVIAVERQELPGVAVLAVSWISVDSWEGFMFRC
jgi:hypothetical protein